MEPTHVETGGWLSQCGRTFVGVKKQFPLELVLKVLLNLYEPPSDQIPHYGKVLHRTLAACRLVCRRWGEIVKSAKDRFIILAYNKEWPSPSFPYGTPQRERLLHSEEESDLGWLSESCRADLIDSHPKFPPELTPNLALGLDMLKYIMSDDIYWSDEGISSIYHTLTKWCLVSREWNKNLTRFLYEYIILGRKGPLRAQLLLHHTFRHTKPDYKSFVKIMEIVPAEDGSTAGLLSICLSMPNLCRLRLKFDGMNPAALPPNLAQMLRSLPRDCTAQLGKDCNDTIDIKWVSLSAWISFIRSSKLILCKFRMISLGGG